MDWSLKNIAYIQSETPEDGVWLPKWRVNLKQTRSHKQVSSLMGMPPMEEQKRRRLNRKEKKIKHNQK